MYKRPDGLYEKTKVIDGKREYFRGKTEREVILKISKYEKKVEQGPLFKDFAADWKEKHFETLSPTTAQGYTAPYNRALKHFGDTLIKDIKPIHIQTYINNLNGLEPYSKKTVSNHLLILNLIFKTAALQGYVENCPTQFVKVPRNLSKQTRELPSANEIEKIKNSINRTFGLFAYFLLYTGLRRGEALALTWEDIDFENNVINVNKSIYHLNNKAYCKSPKTKAGIREVVLMDRLKEKLKKGNGIFFSNDGKHFTDKQFRKLWMQYKTESGVTITPHQLRHAFATICFEAGLDVKDTQEIMGHADISTTRNIYTHISEQRRTKTAKLLNEYDG